MTYRPITFVLLTLALALPAGAGQQQPNEEAAIRATALDYVEGWYTGDAARMERALHPELAKRIVNTNPQNKRSSLGQQSAMPPACAPLCRAGSTTCTWPNGMAAG
jgi:hypothetical protein